MAELAKNSPVEFDAIGLCADLMRKTGLASLATLERGSGFPFVTLTTIALDEDAVPLVLISSLAAHTSNLSADPRFSLLLSRHGKGDPLAHPRLTLTGTAARTESKAAKEQFLARHAKAKLYAGFSDFSIWRLEPIRVHLNGGFGKAHFGPAEPLLQKLRRDAPVGGVEI
jgi:putative heme iron utilization protein